MLGSIGSFLKNRRGAFAMQFALLAVPLTVCTGLAIDGGRAFLARYELASSLDAAALAVGSTFSEDADINAMAHNFVNRNFHGDHEGEIVLELDSTEERVLLKGHVQIKTYFMGLVGQDIVNISAESEVKRGGNNVEVALALDITGSMGDDDDPDSRITALRAAANDLIDTVVNNVQTPYYSRAAIIPWANSVYVGGYADDIRGEMQGPTAITAATWRDGGSHTITGATWRNGAAKNITGAAWRNGTAKTITGITKANPAVVTTSAAHGYADNDYIYISGVSGMTQVNAKRYKIDVTTTTKFSLMDADTGVAINSSSYSTWAAGSPNNGRSQECFTQACEVQVTINTHGYSNGDWIYLASVGGMTQINNSGNTPWTITGVATNTFILPGTNGPSFGTYTSSTGTGSKCFTATCEVQVTSANHGFSDGNLIHIRNVSGMTQINKTNGDTWAISGITTNTFMLPGTSGPTFGTFASTPTTGTAGKCFAAGCEVVVTSTDHNLANGDRVQITGVVGMTGINQTGNSAWLVEAVSGNNFRLDGSIGPNYSDYGSAGSAQCLVHGCIKLRFTNVSGSTVIRPISECVSERVGSNQYTDAAPSVKAVGLDYAGTGYNLFCETANLITPLTDDKTALHAALHKDTGMQIAGSTAGQMGAAWGWYMVSPDWGYLWPEAKNKPAAYDTKDLAKVVVLMTDGEFNTAHCNGVVSSNYGVNNDSDRINCTATNGNPFTQAQNICDGMRAADVKVYTVGFQLAVGGNAESFMEACATDAEHVFLAATNEELKAAFKSIATQISRLRISK
ncbi:MAG: ubiquitin-activating E1 FCCH domain-containing protein [Hyphomonadaceae bacterium]|nr:ubiquitin-activating E1 FCCH domain-containing protein [Hyphomonadaceae bacterium]